MTSEAKSVGGSVFSLFIICKNGSLVYKKDFSQTAKLSSDQNIWLASTFHTLFAISGRAMAEYTRQKGVDGAAPQGIQTLEAKDFRLQCFQTLTGMKFILTAPPMNHQLEKLLQAIYLLYTDYVLKNPFYEIDMPIKCEKFDLRLDALLAPPATTKRSR
eukprot:gb/GEZN01025129.1/.p1 GENE.gb/GEZN01025129.1/~~gb/GEZN01025129.1/.p1  ORF type:complete len:159 (+),score=19.84 gb/GEZN01025129.1/:25-501(+)